MSNDAVNAEPAARGDRRRTAIKVANRTGFVVALVAVLVGIILVPFTIESMIASTHKPVDARAFKITDVSRSLADHLAVNLEVVSLDEVNETMTVRLTGNRVCRPACRGVQILRLYSLRADAAGSQGVPPSNAFRFAPLGKEVDDTFTMPVEGELLGYPFDRYSLRLGVELDSVTQSGAARPLPARTAEHELDLSVGEHVARAQLTRPPLLAPGPLGPGFPEISFTELTFSRPLYLQTLAVIVVVFIALAAIYGVAVRRFQDIVPTVGVIVLGVWGVRSLLVGNFPPDSTVLDLILTMIVVVVLVIVSIRGLFHLGRRAFGRPSSSAELVK